MPRLRAAVPTDCQTLCDLGYEAMALDPYPTMVISKPRIKECAEECISSASAYCWVVEDDEGQVQGCVAAVVHDQLFYERKQASVVMFYCKVPGYGVKLLKHFLAWARGRPVVKQIVFTVEGGADPRIGTLLARLGLKTALPVYIETR